MKSQIQRIADTFYSWMSNFDLKWRKLLSIFRFTAANRLWKLKFFRAPDFKISHFLTSLLCSSVFLLMTKNFKTLHQPYGRPLMGGRQPAMGSCGALSTYGIQHFHCDQIHRHYSIQRYMGKRQWQNSMFSIHNHYPQDLI